MSHGSMRRTKRRSLIIVVAVVAAVVVAAGAAGGYVLLTRTQGTAQQTAASYLQDWQRGSYAAMGKVSVNVPGSGLAAPLRQTAAELGLRRIHTELKTVAYRLVGHSGDAAGIILNFAHSESKPFCRAFNRGSTPAT